MNPFCGRFQVGADHRGRRGLPALGAGAELPPRPPDVTRYTTPPHPSLCNSALARLPTAPVTFVGQEGILCWPTLGWGSPTPPKCHLSRRERTGEGDPPGPRRQLPEKSAAGSGWPLGDHPAPTHPAPRSGLGPGQPRAPPTTGPQPREPRARAPLPAPRHSGLPGRSPL